MAKKSNVGKAVAIGAGVAALSVGAYLLFGPNGKKNRKAARSWMMKMKGEVMEKVEGLKEVTAPLYEKAVSEVGAKYAKLKNVDKGELAAEIAEMKRHWKSMTKKGGAKKKAVKKGAQKPAAKAKK